jgi:hypothetical protein
MEVDAVGDGRNNACQVYYIHTVSAAIEVRIEIIAPVGDILDVQLKAVC